MAAKFDVDFSEALRNLAEFQAKTKGLGIALDQVQASASKPAGAAAKLIKEMHKHYSDLERSLERVGVSSEVAGETMKRSRQAAQQLFQGMALDNLKLTTQAKAYNGELRELERLLKDSSSKSSYVKWAAQAANLNNELSNQNRFLVQSIKAAFSAEGQYNERLKAKLVTNRKILNHDQLRRLKTIELENAIHHLDTAEGRAAASAEVRLSAARRAVQEDEKRRAKLNDLERQLASLHGGQEQEIALIQRQIAERRRQVQSDERARQATVLLTQAEAARLATQSRQASIATAANRATQEAANALSRLTLEEAKAIAKAEALAASTRRHSEALLDEARKSHGMSKAQLELTHNREREIEKLTRLKAQKDLLNSSYGRELAAIQAQIAEQQRYNRLLSMSTAELLGFTGAQRKKTASLQAGAQSAAMMRAALSGLHTNIGMYTSATILAASSTYAVAAALRSAVTIGSEFTATMARADAIMSSSRPNWMADNGSLEAMEMQVRALGQSTAFTASEVAQGLTELGMAGLSAGDAVVALKPALDLAMIGNIGMGQSADIATNVMMTFGKTASDLTEVVDVMATAVTNSNTTIEQLANSLTYAGPAAQTAGISMRDTVAAIEAMANSGIKSSRSGTALRRLFVSLLNPTKKGAAMMEQYGISVLDAEGKTRGLVDIVGQLNKALAGVSGGERLTAIQDLVGVYATSPVAALVDQADNLVGLRQQLDDVAGAAERMRSKIEDGLKFDWKQVVSAFEEVKIVAFESYEMQMREASASLAKYLIDLTAPFETLADGSVITNLDMVLQRAENIAAALAAVGAGALGFKFMSGNVFGAFATDMGKVSDRFQVFKTRVDAATASQVTLTRVTAATHASVMAQGRVVATTTSALGAMHGALATTATRMGMVATAASVLSRSLGWIGLLVGIGYAFNEVFNSDTRQEVLDQKDAVKGLRSSYDELKEAMKGVALEKEKDALRGQVSADNLSIDQLIEKQATLQKLIADSQRINPDADTSALESALGAIPNQLAKYREHVEATNAKLAEMGSTSYDVVSSLAKQETALTDMIGAYQAWQSAKLNLQNSANPETLTKEDVANVEALRQAYLSAAEAAKVANKETQDTQRNLVSLADSYDIETQRQQQAALNKQYESSASATEKLARVRGELLRVEQEMAKLVQQDSAAIASGKLENRPGEDVRNRLLSEQEELLQKRAELTAEADKEAQSLEEARRALEDFHRTDAENLALLKEDLADVMLLRVINNSLAAEGGDLGAAASIKESERLKEELRLRQAIAGIEERLAKPPKKTKEETQLEKELKSAKSAYEALYKQFDPISASLDDVNAKTAQLALLHQHGKITAKEKAQAIWQLRKAHYELTLEQDKNLQSLENLRESYGQSPFSQTLDDVIELNRLMKEGAISMEEYGRLAARMKKDTQEAAVSGAPTANMSLGQASSTPFSEWMSTEIERSQGLGWYQKRGAELQSGYDLDKFNIEQEADAARKAAALLSEEAHTTELLRIEQARSDALLAAKNSFNDQSTALDVSRLEYTEQMNSMITMSMLSTAQNVLGMFASAGEDATAAQKVAFAAQQALAVAQIIMYTHIAAARAEAELGVIAGSAMAAKVMALGYANAGIVAGLAVAQLSTGGSGSSGTSYSGAYDDGGFIPYNSYGIVGEYGPEIVHGPANVTGREKSAKKMAAGGGDKYNITLAPHITVQAAEGAQDSAAANSQAREMATIIKGVVISTMKDQTRSGGMLDNWIKAQKG